jgi:thioredoxin 1
MAEGVVVLSDSNFDAEVLQAALPVLVDFWAPWCGPCKSIGPVIDELAKTYAGKLTVAKLNVDEHPQAPARYNVRGIPNLIIFKDGSVVDQIVGAVPKDQLVEAINRII